MHLFRYLYLPVAATLIAMAIAVPAQAGQPPKLGLSDFGISQAASAALLQPSDADDTPVLRRGPADFRRPNATRRPVAMVPGLKYDHRTMIPRGICRANVWGGL